MLTCRNGHPLTEQTAYVLERERHGGRGCRVCNREAVRRYRQTANGKAVKARYKHDVDRQVGRYFAEWAVRQALKDGRLTKQPCEVCGKSDRVHAHHPLDYRTHPLTVKWLCPLHHAQAHRG